MKNLIRINNNQIIFNKEIIDSNNFHFKLNKYTLRIDEIVLIGLKVGVFFDDDYDSLIILTSKREEFEIPYILINEFVRNKIDVRFSIDMNKSFNSFNYKDYDNFKSIILYPKELFRKPIYKKHSVLTKIYTFIIKKCFYNYYFKNRFTENVLNLFYSRNNIKK